jgi:hypothetical protein
VANGFAAFLITGFLHQFLPVRNQFASQGKHSVKMHPDFRLPAISGLRFGDSRGKSPALCKHKKN